MDVPSLPILRTLSSISPSTYEATLKCPARAAWTAFGDRQVIPAHPSSILGQSYHAVLAAANRGELSDSPGERRTAARHLFKETAERLLAESHAHLRAKFQTAEAFPFFHASSERAALQASLVDVSRPRSKRTPSPPGPGEGKIEGRLVSLNGRVVGRLDRIDESTETIIDYKSGRGGGETLSDPEKRQLRLYVHLAAQNGMGIRRGAIIRSSGQRITEEISAQEASDEATHAEQLLDDLNSKIEQGVSFDGLATPTPQSCRDCPCIPFCARFWGEAKPDWGETVGCNVEGRITSIHESRVRGVQLATLSLDILRGSAPVGLAAVQPFPINWMTAGGGAPPANAGLIRVVGARISAETLPASIFVDRAGTTLWSVKK